MVNLKGSLRISRPQYGDGRKQIEITVIDERAACQVIEVHVGLEAFTEALTGCSADCDFDFNNSGVVGMVYEHKTESVPIPDMLFREEDPRIFEALVPFEVDGWEGNRRDVTNHHRRSRKGKQEFACVTFTRHVPAAIGGEGKAATQ